MNEVIYVDHSILSTVAACEEKGRLSYIEHLRPKRIAMPLTFGSAWHAGLAAIYNGYELDLTQDELIKLAQLAFYKEYREAGFDSLPLTSEEGERRSVERGLNMLEAYIKKWESKDRLWRNLHYTAKETGEQRTYVEIGFACYLMEWQGHPVVYVGKIDRIRLFRINSQVYMWESKSTVSNVKTYSLQTRPNHQITGYYWILEELLGIKLGGAILDVAYISDREIGGKFESGVDIENDFARYETHRSTRDIEEFLYDIRRKATEFLQLQDDLVTNKITRGYRNAPSSCSSYGGCHFRRVCETNANPQIIDNLFIKQKWEPWANIVGESQLIVSNSEVYKLEMKTHVT